MPASAKWDEMPCLSFDTETTGVDPATARIVTAALVATSPGQRPAIRRYVVDPGIDIPDEAAQVHGYTRDRAIAEQTHTPEQMLFEVTGHIARAMGRGLPVVVFNAAYDLTLLDVENIRHGIDPLPSRLGGFDGIAPVVDPMVLAKHHEPYRIRTVKGPDKQPILTENEAGEKVTTKYCHNCECGATDWTLSSVCLHYGVRHTGEHDAAADALAAARLWPRILHVGGRTKFRGYQLPGLHAAQVDWRAAQCDGLREYFDKNEIEHDGVPRDWPVLRDTVLAARDGVAA